jgi:hypothetical protein
MPHTQSLVPSGVENTTYSNRDEEIERLKAENDLIRKENKEILNRLSQGT